MNQIRAILSFVRSSGKANIFSSLRRLFLCEPAAEKPSLKQGDNDRNARATELHKMRKTVDEYNAARTALAARRAKSGGE